MDMTTINPGMIEEYRAPAKSGLATAAGRLRSMHRRGDPLVLVNAWDVASAQRVVAAGGRAVATSSAAIAASLGLPDDPSGGVAHRSRSGGAATARCP